MTTLASAAKVRSNLPGCNPVKMVDEIDWEDPEQVKLLKALVSEQTPEGLSAYARHVAGYNFFKVVGRNGRQEHVRSGPRRWKRGIVWTCGAVDYGPHREMLRAFLDPENYTIICSRDAFKTHMAQAWIAQYLSINRDMTWIVYMMTLDQAAKTVLAIRNILESDASKRLFGDFKGDSAHWKTDSFTVCGRSNAAERNPSVSAAGVDKFVTGAHCDGLYVDDPVGPQTVRSRDQIDKSIEGYQYLQPLKNPGCIEKITITPYVAGDFCDWTLAYGRNKTIFLPCGMVAGVDDSGAKTLTGHPAFPHLTEAHLAEVLGSGMTVERFNRQFALHLEDQTDQHFKREDFVPAVWDDRMSRMNAYLMTDTATSNRSDACMSVLGMVILDWDATAYFADIELGRWKPTEVLERIFGMIGKWQSKVNFCGVVMERATLNDVYRAWMDQESSRRGIRLRLIDIPRGGALDSEKQPVHKQQRIAGLQNPIAAHKIKFLNTLPRTFVEEGRIKTLYDPLGYQAPGQPAQPSGIIVDHAIAWRNNANYKGPRDILDMMADLHAVNPSDGRRLLALPSRGVAAPDSVRKQTHDHRTTLRKNYWERMQTKR